MPTLVRLLTTLGVIAALVFAGMAALVYLVEPTPREIVVDVPLDLSGVADETAARAAPAGLR